MNNNHNHNIKEQLYQIGEIHKKAGDLEYHQFNLQQNLIKRILQLREEKNVLILGHNYMAPLVYHLSGRDERGDSLQLAQRAAKSTNPIILFDGVRFMAETAKILNPDKKVLIADLDAGCSLADPFKAQEIRQYKEQYPGIPVVLYINSYAEAKAEADYCCTSSNAIKVIKHAAREFGTNKVLFLPDTLMGRNLEDELLEKNELENEKTLELIYPGKYDQNYGRCYVHEQIDAQTIQYIRQTHGLKKGDLASAVLVHYECKPEVRAAADFCTSTSGMIKYIREHQDLQKVYLGTECEMTANVAMEFPQIEFVRGCSFSCEHMARITLEKMVDALELEQPEITVDPEIARRALLSIERMLKIG